MILYSQTTAFEIGIRVSYEAMQVYFGWVYICILWPWNKR